MNAGLPHNVVVAAARSANPDRVLVSLERFVASVPERLETVRYLSRHPRVTETLATVFAGSQFISEILLRQPDNFDYLKDRRRLVRRKAAGQLRTQALASIAHFLDGSDGLQYVAALDALRRFQRGELLRIGACDLLGLFDLPTVTAQLSHLADGLTQACLALAARRTGLSPAHFAVLAMGKLGGEELNYSSDIDLMFIARSNGGDYKRLGEALIDSLTRTTAEGFLYRVDMRLRPWGHTGPLVSTLEAHLGYLQNEARLWEKQALLKARAIAGDESLGAEFLRRAEPLLFAVDRARARADVHEMKQRTEARLRKQGRDWGEVKLGEGSIRDVEFVTQFLQLAHGSRSPEIVCNNTLDALARLWRGGWITTDEYRTLADGYAFLRSAEHHLQLMDYRQTHSLPRDSASLAELALRLGFQGAESGALFVARYQAHSAAIRAVYRRYLEADVMETPARDRSPEVRRHVARMAPSYAETFGEPEIEHHADLVARLDEDHLVEVEAAPIDDERWRVTIVGYDYLGELSLICGLLFVHGLNIMDGHVFTYEPLPASGAGAANAPGQGAPRRPLYAGQPQATRRPARTASPDSQRKIVDVFTVHRVVSELPSDLWARYREDLETLLRLLHAGQGREAQGQLAKRFALALRPLTSPTPTLYPIDVEIDNESDRHYTILRIDADDTIGFLYEFSNALALNGVSIARVEVETIGTRVHDTLFVTDARGDKIAAPDKWRELRAATVLVKHFTHLLPRSPNPEAALLNFRQFVGQLFQRPDWPAELAAFDQPKVLEALARLLGVSDFLWEDFLRMQYDNLAGVVSDVDALATAKSKQAWEGELATALSQAHDGAAKRAVVNAFKDREMFRVDMRNIQGHTPEFEQFAAELADLAEVVVDATYRLCDEDLRARFGEPRLDDGAPCPVTVCALGKAGGRELGYASDVELMFVYAGNGRTSGPSVIAASEFYERLVQEFVQSVRAKREGIFEIDLRLRPYGNAGSLAVSLRAFRDYFAPDGPAWDYERQSLVRLRPIAGDVEFGKEIVALRDEFVYSGRAFDVAAMRAMRERQLRHIVTGGTLNVKFSPGGLVDVEYLVQGLQMTHGHASPRLRATNTFAAMTALKEAGVLAGDDYERLRRAYNFLRQVINALRVVRGNAREMTVPSTESEEFAFLARRLGYNGDLVRLRDDLLRHTTDVREINGRLLG